MSMGGNDETQVGGTPAATPEDPDDKRKLWLIVGGVLLAGALIGAGIAVASGGGGDEAADGTTTSSSTSTSTSTTVATSPSGGGGGGGGGTTTTTNVNDDPKIDSYTASPGSLTCALPTSSVSVTLSWATTNTNQVVLSVDGPGAYKTYNTSSGSETLTPGCPAMPGTSEQHTYTITAKGPDGPDAVKTITYSINTVP